jgi:hypothetical protein
MLQRVLSVLAVMAAAMAASPAAFAGFIESAQWELERAIESHRYAAAALAETAAARDAVAAQLADAQARHAAALDARDRDLVELAGLREELARLDRDRRAAADDEARFAADLARLQSQQAAVRDTLDHVRRNVENAAVGIEAYRDLLAARDRTQARLDARIEQIRRGLIADPQFRGILDDRRAMDADLARLRQYDAADRGRIASLERQIASADRALAQIESDRVARDLDAADASQNLGTIERDLQQAGERIARQVEQDPTVRRVSEDLAAIDRDVAGLEQAIASVRSQRSAIQSAFSRAVEAERAVAERLSGCDTTIARLGNDVAALHAMLGSHEQAVAVAAAAEHDARCRLGVAQAEYDRWIVVYRDRPRVFVEGGFIYRDFDHGYYDRGHSRPPWHDRHRPRYEDNGDDDRRERPRPPARPGESDRPSPSRPTERSDRDDERRGSLGRDHDRPSRPTPPNHASRDGPRSRNEHAEQADRDPPRASRPTPSAAPRETRPSESRPSEARPSETPRERPASPSARESRPSESPRPSARTESPRDESRARLASEPKREEPRRDEARSSSESRRSESSDSSRSGRPTRERPAERGR